MTSALRRRGSRCTIRGPPWGGGGAGACWEPPRGRSWCAFFPLPWWSKQLSSAQPSCCQSLHDLSVPIRGRFPRLFAFHAPGPVLGGRLRPHGRQRRRRAGQAAPGAGSGLRQPREGCARRGRDPRDGAQKPGTETSPASLPADPRLVLSFALSLLTAGAPSQSRRCPLRRGPSRPSCPCPRASPRRTTPRWPSTPSLCAPFELSMFHVLPSALSPVPVCTGHVATVESARRAWQAVSRAFARNLCHRTRASPRRWQPGVSASLPPSPPRQHSPPRARRRRCLRVFPTKSSSSDQPRPSCQCRRRAFALAPFTRLTHRLLPFPTRAPPSHGGFLAS